MAKAPLLVIGILLVAPSADASWAQYSLDAARTNYTLDEAPRRPDIAFTVDLPGSLIDYEPPLIINGMIYGLVADRGIPGKGQSGMFAVDTATGSLRWFRTLEAPFPTVFSGEPTSALLTDGTRLIAWLDRGLHVFDLDGNPKGTWDIGSLALPNHHATYCPGPGLVQGVVYLFCQEVGSIPTADGNRVAGPPVTIFGAAIDLETLQPKWLWVKNQLHESYERSQVSLGEVLAPPDLDQGTSTTYTAPLGCAVIGDHVIMTGLNADAEGAATSFYASHPIGTVWLTHWTFDRATGAFQWERHSPPVRPLTPASQLKSVASLPPNGGAYFIATGDASRNVAYLPLGDLDASAATSPTSMVPSLLEAVNLAQGNTLGSVPISGQDVQPGSQSGGLALGAAGLFVTSTQVVFKLDPSTLQGARAFALERASSTIRSPPVVAGNVLLVREGQASVGAILHVIDHTTGQELWNATYRLPQGTPGNRTFDFSSAEGLVAVLRLDGDLIVFGTSGASIRIDPKVAKTAVAPGALVRIDMANTGAGSQGAATRFRVDWGDGNVTDWQSDPAFAHAYTSEASFVAVAYARNDANQSSSREIRFDVGPQLTPLQRAFSRENQDTTFFVLGLALTLVGAFFGYLRFVRRQSRLRRELRRVEQLYVATRERPPECDNAMRESKARARSLLLENKLGEAHFTALSHRIEELQGQVRLETLEGRFPFLPVGLLRSLQRILSDGNVTRGELDRFVRLLDTEPHLTKPEQKEVRTWLEDWFRRDTKA